MSLTLECRRETVVWTKTHSKIIKQPIMIQEKLDKLVSDKNLKLTVKFNIIYF